jgi:serine phosphatase RsbU (regulator of sigma subunit)
VDIYSNELARPWRPWTGLGIVGAIFPGVVLGLAVLADMLFPAWYCPFSPPLVVVVPALAAATGGIIGAGGYTAISAVVSVLMSNYHQGMELPGGGQMPMGMHEGLLSGQLVALGVTFFVALIPAYLRTRRERSYRRLQSVSEAVQKAILVPVPERGGSVRAAVDYIAAADEARIGGDLYDLVDTPFGTRMIIGDVRGKGLSAVASANNVLGAFRELASSAPTLAELGKRLDGSVRRHRERTREVAEDFVTATIVSVLDRTGGTDAEVLSCGHPTPLLLHAGGVAEVPVKRHSPPLGLGSLAAEEPQVTTITLAEGDGLLLYTDGVTEARDGAGVFYPLAERAAAWADAAPAEVVRGVVRDLTAYTGGHLNDDAALLVVRRVAVSAPGTGQSDHRVRGDGQAQDGRAKDGRAKDGRDGDDRDRNGRDRDAGQPARRSTPAGVTR